jgi:hypothetical protein
MMTHELRRKSSSCGPHKYNNGVPKLQRKASTERVPEAVPPIVSQVLASPGHPLDAATRKQFEPRFGVDFGSVRIHDDSRAGESARAVSAHAYTVGRDIVFAGGQYEPQSTRGARLLAHELTHVAQQGTSVHPNAALGRMSNPGDRSELEAGHVAETDNRASEGAQPSSAVHAPGQAAPVVHRSIIGGLLGGLAGAAAGAVAGSLLGPVGTVVGGIVGFVGGALGADKLTTKARSLTAKEIAYAKEIYLDTIDFLKVKITKGSLLSLGAAKTIGNTIYLPASKDLFVGDTMELTDWYGLGTLIHELGHVWQYQNGGLAYIPLSLIAQLKGFLKSGSRDAAYNWEAADAAGLPWEKWNPEQQASAMEYYNYYLRLSRTRLLSPEEQKKLSTLTGNMAFVHAKLGMPSFHKPKKEATAK